MGDGHDNISFLLTKKYQDFLKGADRINTTPQFTVNDNIICARATEFKTVTETCKENTNELLIMHQNPSMQVKTNKKMALHMV